ncbi:MAG: DUF4340 domain-containing protein [Candidatus Omnitrophica bacterium]|nr:DUF4340 domain-containing protein [Candidatus Omnitrophota bacterium]
MNSRQLTILGVVLAVLVAAVAIKRFQPRKEVFREETQSLDVRVDTGAADRITISKGTPEAPAIELAKTESTWTVPSAWHAKADGERIKRLLTRLTELTGERRGNREQLFDDFGITDAKAIHITLSQRNTELLHVLLGTKSVGWDQFFLRRAGSPAVFLCRSNLLSSELGIFGNLESATLKAESWVDRRLFDAAPETVTGVELREGSGEWRRLEADLAPYLQSLANLNATEVVDPDGSGYGLEQPVWQLRLTKKEGAPIELAVGGTRAGSTDARYVKVTAIPPLMVRNGVLPFPAPPAPQTVYVVSSSVLEQIKTGFEDRMKKPAPDTQPTS